MGHAAATSPGASRGRGLCRLDPRSGAPAVVLPTGGTVPRPLAEAQGPTVQAWLVKALAGG